MDWVECLFLSAVLFLAFSGVFVWKMIHIPKKPQTLRTFFWLGIGVFAASFFLLLPLHRHADSSRAYYWTAALHHAMQMFTVDADCGLIQECPGILETYKNAGAFLERLPFGLKAPDEAGLARYARAYTHMLSTAHILAPLFTFGFIISLFKNATAYVRYFLRFFCSKYVFSELNEKSLALAKSIKKNRSFLRRFFTTIVFADVFERDEEPSFELKQEAMRLRAIFFRQDIVHIPFHLRFFGIRVTIFAMGGDETENINQAVSIIENYPNLRNCCLYVFSTRIESELILNAQAPKSTIEVRRINDVQSLIYQELFSQVSGKKQAGAGKKSIFETARKIHGENGTPVPINAVIVGTGQHGTEMIKALAWFCQMDGFRLSIHAFDKDPLAAEKFALQCPELMDKKHNGQEITGGEAYCEIAIRGNVDTESVLLTELVSKIRDVCYVLVSLGSDEANIRTAVMLRALFERLQGADRRPMIQTVVYNSDEAAALKEITNFKRQRYDIDFIADLDSAYAEDIIINSELEASAWKCHTKWAVASDEERKYFRSYEYHYRSSCASAIHNAARRKHSEANAKADDAQKAFDRQKAVLAEAAGVTENAPEALRSAVGGYLDTCEEERLLTDMLGTLKAWKEKLEKEETFSPGEEERGRLCRKAGMLAEALEVLGPVSGESGDMIADTKGLIGAIRTACEAGNEPLDPEALGEWIGKIEESLQITVPRIRRLKLERALGGLTAEELKKPGVSGIREAACVLLARERTLEEAKRSLAVLEHQRWNAYMRAEGWCYGRKRNNLGKQHPDLVPFDALPITEQLKDTRIAEALSPQDKG